MAYLGRLVNVEAGTRHVSVRWGPWRVVVFGSLFWARRENFVHHARLRRLWVLRVGPVQADYWSPEVCASTSACTSRATRGTSRGA